MSRVMKPGFTLSTDSESALLTTHQPFREEGSDAYQAFCFAEQRCEFEPRAVLLGQQSDYCQEEYLFAFLTPNNIQPLH